jgi:type I restriction enzyme S subunit
MDRNTGSRMPRADIRQMMAMEVPLPPLDEQRRIVDLLNRAAGIRRLREQALAKARAIVPALFLDMFGDPVTNPKVWPIISFGALVAEFRYGTSVKCHDEYQTGDLPILRVPNVIGASVNWSDLKYASLPDREVERLRLVPGDLLFVRTNGNPAYIGRSVVLEYVANAAFASYLIRARLVGDAPAIPLFVREAMDLSTYRPNLLRAARTTAGNYNISIEGLSGLPIPLPPLALQHTFASRLADLRSVIAQQERALASARALEQALMARLLG